MKPRYHVPGHIYLRMVRGERREPPRPYTFDAVGLTDAEYQEVLIARSRFVGVIAPTVPLPRPPWEDR